MLHLPAWHLYFEVLEAERAPFVTSFMRLLHVNIEESRWKGQ